MKASIRQRLARDKRRIKRRLKRARKRALRDRTCLGTRGLKYDRSDRTSGLAYGGVALMHRLAEQVGLVEAIDRRLSLLKLHLPYHESDHVLNFAYNAFCDGRCLDDIELRRSDEAFLNALGTTSIPDPTTAGDFCRRFTSEDHLRSLMDAIDEARINVWRQQPETFFEQAVIDADGSLVETTGKCKQGMDLSYKSTWGYHPLLVSLANTGEILSLVNRSGNRPSEEGAAAELDRAIGLCRNSGFRHVLLRGDTAFSQTHHLDRWDHDHVEFVFGYPAASNLVELAESLPEQSWQRLVRPPSEVPVAKQRRRPERIKESVVRHREFKNLRLQSESVSDFEYQPTACQQAYRMVVVRKNISVEKGERRLFDELRFFFYITNNWEMETAEVVQLGHERCHQENLIAQLSGSVRALTAPVDNLLSNWAYMLMTSLAWTMKSWAALLLPIAPRWAEKHQHDKRQLLHMEFRTFVNRFIRIPCQVIRKSRRLILRVLTWNPDLPVFFRLCHCLRC